MGRRVLVLGSAVALAASAPGCITAIAAAAGADARTIQSALEADLAIGRALVGDGTGSRPLAYEEEAVPVTAGEADRWRCLLQSGEEQLVVAYSVEGARAACLMANDVDLVGDGCRCFPAR